MSLGDSQFAIDKIKDCLETLLTINDFPKRFLSLWIDGFTNEYFGNGKALNHCVNQIGSSLWRPSVPSLPFRRYFEFFALVPISKVVYAERPRLMVDHIE